MIESNMMQTTIIHYTTAIILSSIQLESSLLHSSLLKYPLIEETSRPQLIILQLIMKYNKQYFMLLCAITFHYPRGYHTCVRFAIFSILSISVQFWLRPAPASQQRRGSILYESQVVGCLPKSGTNFRGFPRVALMRSLVSPEKVPLTILNIERRKNHFILEYMTLQNTQIIGDAIQKGSK